MISIVKVDKTNMRTDMNNSYVSAKAIFETIGTA